MKRKKKGPLFRQDRARIFKDKRGDPYQRKQKLPDPTLCPHCGAVFTKGRWSWDSVDFIENEEVCPACQRIEDDYPAGVVEVEGDFYQAHKEEIMHLFQNLEEHETLEHPMERIMQISEQDDGITVITTTGMHLPEMIGKALKSSYDGDLDISFDAESITRVHWVR